MSHGLCRCIVVDICVFASAATLRLFVAMCLWSGALSLVRYTQYRRPRPRAYQCTYRLAAGGRFLSCATAAAAGLFWFTVTIAPEAAMRVAAAHTMKHEQSDDLSKHIIAIGRVTGAMVRSLRHESDFVH